ncbi:hypothetical protein FB45DRAFT_906183 [Roridomyces roridus]|uniref:Uncharacterized protein n=1 Tax=Roridomyces roridus TaxID=1738132 RepID=A0AAD7C110_9AGAR|nr:hypothetical protein FB45DRAFT_906183 [Roridomyces roridus]
MPVSASILGPLVLSFAFRVATMHKSPDPFWHQRFSFFGGCADAYPRYTTARIFLNRSIARPLVRGESKIIIILRAVVISCLALGVPAFTIYSVVIAPVEAEIHSQIVRGSFEFQPADAAGGISIFLEAIDPASSSDIQLSGGSVEGVDIYGLPFVCDSIGGGNFQYLSDTGARSSATYHFGWGGVSKINISVSDAAVFGGVYVTLHQGNQTERTPEMLPLAALFPGSNLLGILAWSEERIISSRIWDFTRSHASIFTPEITSLQPSVPISGPGSRSASIILVQPTTYLTAVYEDTVSTTALSGIATIGGFWTALNGVFALFFGANVIYFAFGRRPLSALGVAHIFQRQDLVRQWNQDFPALRTEGGLPGSKGAGIVAFIRERLVDVGEEPEFRGDLEAQNSRAATGEVVEMRSQDATATQSVWNQQTPLMDDDAERHLGANS